MRAAHIAGDEPGFIAGAGVDENQLDGSRKGTPQGGKRLYGESEVILQDDDDRKVGRAGEREIERMAGDQWHKIFGSTTKQCFRLAFFFAVFGDRADEQAP